MEPEMYLLIGVSAVLIGQLVAWSIGKLRYKWYTRSKK